MSFGSSAFGVAPLGAAPASGDPPDEEAAPLTLTLRFVDPAYDNDAWRTMIAGDVETALAAYVGVPALAYWQARYASVSWVFVVESASYPPGTETRERAELAELIFLGVDDDADLVVESATVPNRGTITLTFDQPVQWTALAMDAASYALTPGSYVVQRVFLDAAGTTLTLRVAPAIAASDVTITVAEGALEGLTGGVLADRSIEVEIPAYLPPGGDARITANVLSGCTVGVELPPGVTMLNRDPARLTDPFQHEVLPGPVPETWFPSEEEANTLAVAAFRNANYTTFISSDNSPAPWPAVILEVPLLSSRWLATVDYKAGGTFYESVVATRPATSPNVVFALHDPIRGGWYFGNTSTGVQTPVAPFDHVGVEARTARFQTLASYREEEGAEPYPVDIAVYADRVRFYVRPSAMFGWQDAAEDPYYFNEAFAAQATLAGLEAYALTSPPPDFAITSVVALNATTVLVTLNAPPAGLQNLRPVSEAFTVSGFDTTAAFVDTGDLATTAVQITTTTPFTEGESYTVVVNDAPLTPGEPDYLVGLRVHVNGLGEPLYTSRQALRTPTRAFVYEDQTPPPDPIDTEVAVQVRLTPDTPSDRAAADYALAALYGAVVRGAPGPTASEVEAALDGEGLGASSVTVSRFAAGPENERLVLGAVTYLEPLATGDATVFHVAFGSAQGRIQRPDGTWVFELGHAARVLERAAPGDKVRLAQMVVADDRGEYLERMTLRIVAPPKRAGRTDTWVFRVLRDDVVFYERTILPNGRTLELKDIAVPWRGASSPATVAAELELLGWSAEEEA